MHFYTAFERKVPANIFYTLLDDSKWSEPLKGLFASKGYEIDCHVFSGHISILSNICLSRIRIVIEINFLSFVL